MIFADHFETALLLYVNIKPEQSVMSDLSFDQIAKLTLKLPPEAPPQLLYNFRGMELIIIPRVDIITIFYEKFNVPVLFKSLRITAGNVFHFFFR